jgi:hypothetical protein
MLLQRWSLGGKILLEITGSSFESYTRTAHKVKSVEDDTRYIARATLDNIELPDEHDEIQLSDFVIRLCPNHAQPIPIEEENGMGTDVDWQYPAKPDIRFPVCDYYLEIPFTPVSSRRWKEAEDKLLADSVAQEAATLDDSLLDELVQPGATA